MLGNIVFWAGLAVFLGFVGIMWAGFSGMFDAPENRERERAYRKLYRRY